MRWFSVFLAASWFLAVGCEETKTVAPGERGSSPSLPPSSSPGKTSASREFHSQGPNSTIERLILEWKQSLDSPDPQARSFAALSLLRSEHFEAKRALGAALHDNSNPAKRAAVIKAYGFDRDDSIMDAMGAALADKNAEVCAAASWALANFRTPAAVKMLSSFLTNEGNPVSARISVANALGATRSESAVEPLFACLESKDVKLKEAAYASLVEVTRNTSLGMDKTKWEKWWERNRLRTREEWLEEEVSSLNKTVTGLHETSTEIRSLLADKTIKVLEQRSNKDAPEPLLEALQNPEARVRLYAVQELAKLDVSARVPTMIESLRDKDPEVRKAAATALGEIGDKKAAAPLMKALKDENNLVRAAAASSLGHLGGKEGVSALIGLLKDPDVEVASAAAAALGEIGDRDAVDPLMSVLSDGKNRTKARESAAAALGKLGDSRSAKALIAALRDNEERVRWFAAIALGQIKAQEAIEPLGQLLANDANANVRLSAASSLGMVGNLKAEPYLTSALNDKDQAVAAQAAEALLALAGDNFDALSRIGKLFYDRRDDARAVKALVKLVEKYKGDPARKDQLMPIRKMRASALVRLEQWGAAREEYSALCGLEPGDAALRREFLKCLINDNEYVLAIKTCGDGVKLDPDHAREWWDRIAEIIEEYHKQIDQASLDQLIADLESNHPSLGGEEIKPRIIKFKSSEKPPPPPPKEDQKDKER